MSANNNNMDYRRRIRALKDKIGNCIQPNELAPDESALKELALFVRTIAGDVNADTEISFRELLYEMISAQPRHQSIDEKSNITKLIKISLEIGQLIYEPCNDLGDKENQIEI